LLRVTFASFRKLYDLLRDGVPSRTDDAVTLLKGDYSDLEGDAQKTCGLGVKPVALQVMPDRHGRNALSLTKKLIKNMRM
jgi:hypothetical protein